MAKKRIKDTVSDLLNDYLSSQNLELFNVEYVKEGKDHYLRVYIDKPPKEDGTDDFIGIEECEAVSRYLSEKLDETDPIAENYFLEVSSPGLDRPLIKDSDYIRYAGRLVDINFYKAFENTKKMTAELISLNNGIVSVKNDKNEIKDIPIEQISKIKLAVVF